MELKTLNLGSKAEAIDEGGAGVEQLKGDRRTLLGHGKEQFSIEKPPTGSG